MVFLFFLVLDGKFRVFHLPRLPFFSVHVHTWLSPPFFDTDSGSNFDRQRYSTRKETLTLNVSWVALFKIGLAAKEACGDQDRPSFRRKSMAHPTWTPHPGYGPYRPPTIFFETSVVTPGHVPKAVGRE